MKSGRTVAITIVCLILGIMVAWQYKSVNYNQNVMSYENKRAEELMEELIRLQKSNADLRAQLTKLQEDVRLYESAKAGSDETYRNLLNELAEARTFAGLTDVKGKGVIITLKGEGLSTVYDEDILDVINELRAAGAQAISVNDERVVATTEVRKADPYIMVNKIPMTEPFVIKAIGDPDQLYNSLHMIRGVVEKLQGYSIDVKVEKSDEIFIPKVRDDGSVIKIDLLEPVN
ncbi:MAG TPA: DUF881 domain-containing protein [Clostridiaceae bacterium]|nr:DUF881 domain-containing protein [Clostridiaceae bacterium]